MSQINANAILDASGGTTASINGYTPSASNMTGRNRIINGAMMIDQRNAGASVTQTTSVSYNLDRWFAYGSQASKFTVQQNAGSVTPPIGFSNYLGVTSSSAYSVLSGDLFFVGQYIEGFNFADLGWGTSDAKTVTLSFWVRSSLTGTFGGGLANNALNRSYPFSYTINSANTWEQKSITIAGDTTGTWVGSTNGVGLRLWLSVGMGSTYSGTAGSWASTDYRSATGATSVVGTSGATWYITGVQLEVGSTASEFEHRLYGQELALCQRYFEKSYSYSDVPGAATSTDAHAMRASGTSAYLSINANFAVEKRSTPVMAFYAPSTGTAGYGWNESAGTTVAISNTYRLGTKRLPFIILTAGGTDNHAYMFHFTASAEL